LHLVIQMVYITSPSMPYGMMFAISPSTMKSQNSIWTVFALVASLSLAYAEVGNDGLPDAPTPADDSPNTPGVSVIKIKTQVKDVPDSIRKLDPALSLMDPSLPFEVTFGLVNDSVYREKGGTDDGYTHGAFLVGGYRFQNGLHLTVAYSTDLYTAPVPGDSSPTRNEKYFTNENVLRFIADNVQQNKVWYWKAEAGWRRLGNETQCNFLDAECQQIWFHKILNDFKTVASPVDIAQGRGIQDSPLAGGAIGLQQFTPLGKPNIVLVTREDIGTELSTVTDASDAYSDVSVAAAYVLKGEYRFEFGGKLLSKAFAQGFEFQPGWEAQFGTKHWIVGVERKHYLGTVQNYVLYNLPSPNGKYDPITTIYVDYRFKK
jgi:hypothetical protein